MNAPAATLAGSSLPEAMSANGAVSVAGESGASGSRYGVSIGGQRLLLDGSGAVRVLEPGPISRLPNTHQWCLGLANVRGQLLPVFDVAKWQNLSVAGAERMLLVIGTDEQAAAILVDASPRNLLVSGMTCTTPELPEGFAAHAVKSFALGDGIWTELDWAALFEELKLAAVNAVGDT